jgi:hypothetical protein
MTNMESTAEIYNIYYDKDLHATVMEWHGYANSQEFREGTELMLNTLIQYRCSKVLADIREMVLIGQDDQAWLETNFLPRAIRFGFKQIAIIRPRSYFNQVAVESISYKIDKSKITLNFFDNLKEGKDWLGGSQCSL